MSKSEFQSYYGTHFLIGWTKGCTMDILLKKKVSGSSSRTEVAASLSGTYNMFSLSLGGSYSTSKSELDT